VDYLRNRLNVSIVPFSVLFGSHYVASGSNPFTVIGGGSTTLGANGTTITLSGLTFPGGNVVLSVCNANVDGDATAISGVTFNGTSGTIDARAVAGTIAASAWAISANSVAAGSGSIVITFSSSERHTVVWSAYDIGTRTLQATDTSNTSLTALSDTVNVNSDGVVVSAYWVSLNNHTSDFNAGVDSEQRAVLFPTNRYAMVGSRLYPSSATPATVTSSSVSSSTTRSATASYS